LVKPPKEEAAEENREYMIPVTFKRYCGKNYQLKKIRVKDYPQLTVTYLVGPRHPTFAIYDKNGVVVAEFHPNGYANCKSDSFRSTFEKMVGDIEESAQKIIQKYEDYDPNNIPKWYYLMG
jgi:hypothetical protein